MVATTPTQQNARVTRTARAYRRRLIALELQAQRQIAAAYQTALDTLIDELETATINAGRAIAGGRDPNTFRVQRAVELVRQAEQLLQQAARQTGIQIGNQRQAAGQLALQAAGDLLDAVMGPPPPDLPNASSFMAFPRAAVETITGSLSDGPVRELLDRYGADAARQAGRLLTGAIVTGQHPRTITKPLAQALNAAHWQAARLARTEINRAYRESLRETWAANKAITPQWEWVSGQTSRTCAVCWAMDGQRFDVEEPMGTHPNCRCCLSPVSIGWNDLAARYGVTMPPGDWDPPPRPVGPEVFAGLPAADQLRVLGPAKYAAYRRGEIELRDLVHASDSPDWGITRREGSLEAARQRAGRRGGASGSGAATRPSITQLLDDRMPQRGQHRATADAAREAVGVIDQVHGVTHGYQVPITVDALPLGVDGEYAYYQAGSDWRPHHIVINRNAVTPRLTTAHEIGHYLDQQFVARSYGLATDHASSTVTGAPPALARLQQAILATPEVTQLRTMERMGRAGGIVRLPTGQVHQPVAGYARYLLEMPELFARSYAQYIARHGGSPAWLQELNDLRSGTGATLYPLQWDDATFDAIAAAFDDLFTDLGVKR